jgi:hypothetical protein
MNNNIGRQIENKKQYNELNNETIVLITWKLNSLLTKIIPDPLSGCRVRMRKPL